MRNANKLYRFWGRTPPEQTDTPNLIRAETPTTTDSGEATLYLYGPIDSWGGFWGISAAEVAAALSALPTNTADLTLRINSPGGEVFEAVAIMNLLRDHPAKITARVDGIAASAGSFLAVSADELIMGGSTELMIHDAWGLAIGNAEDMRSYADLLDRTSDDIAAVYEAKAGGGKSAWRDYMKDETWFSAEEAVAAGLADSVNTGTDEDTEGDQPANRFDTEALFNHAGRLTAPAPKPVPAAAGTPPAPAARDDGTAAALEAELNLRHRHNARKLTLGLH
jgi:ATP-dependent protease ClpP protease subunit